MRNVLYTVGITGVVVGIAAYKLVTMTEHNEQQNNERMKQRKKILSKTKYFNSTKMCCQLFPRARGHSITDMHTEESPLLLCDGKVEVSNSVARRIFSFCEISDLCRIKMASKTLRKLCDSVLNDKMYLRDCATRGFDTDFRGEYWLAISKCSIVSEMEEEYLKSQVHKTSNLQQEEKDRIRIKDIKKDMTRTLKFNENGDLVEFEGTAQGKEEERETLENILVKYCTVDHQVGYVQGMNFVALTALRNFKQNENKTLGFMRSLMFEYDLRSMYFSHLPRLKICLFVFDFYLKEFAPQIFNRFRRLGIKVEMFASEWFLTLFSYNFPEFFTERVWDFFVFEGWPFLHAIGVSLLLHKQEMLMNLSFEKTLEKLKPLKIGRKEVSAIIEKALLLNISAADVDLQHRRFISLRLFL